MIASRADWPATRSLSRLPLIVFLAIAVVCAACGQTGPLTLDRPVDAAPAAEPAVVEPAEPDEPDEPDEPVTDGGAADDPGDAGAR